MIRHMHLVIVMLLICITPLAHGQQKKRQKKRAVSDRAFALYEPGEYKGVKYRLMKPIDYDGSKAYPLVLSLHGAGGRGSDNVKNVRNWNEYLAEESLRRKHPCFVLVPQSVGPWSDPTSAEKLLPELSQQDVNALPEAWRSRLKRYQDRTRTAPGGNLHIVLDLIDNKLAKNFSIDSDRIYCLGHSMGGYGAFTAIYQHPDRFAAAIPTAGGFPPWRDATRIKDVPIWTFHGSVDTVVPTDFTRQIFATMKEMDGNMKYTELRDVAHGANAVAFRYQGDDEGKGYITRHASDRTNRTSDVWDWLFQHQLSDRRPE